MNEAIHDMGDTIDHVIELSQELQQLRERLNQLDAERSSITARIADCMARLSGATAAHVRPPRNASFTERVLWMVRQQDGRAIAPRDAASALGLSSETDLTNVRVALGRLARRGDVKRVGHGRYVAADKT